jgi:ABC-type branched-subunit amino acid transport system ATPase component
MKNNLLLRVYNLDKHFGGVYAVHNCSLGVREGTITSIIGPNGAGKTTLFNLITGILRPDKGSVMFRKANITGFKPHQVARAGVSRTFQQAKVFRNMTVRDNLLLARPASDAELKKVLGQVHYARELDTIAGELSYGNQRLVEIARALLLPHSLLMLDEPTAGVNPKVRQELKGILKDLKREGHTIVLIEHDMDFVMSISDEVIVLNEGTVLTSGTPAKVRNDRRVLEAYLGK